MRERRKELIKKLQGLGEENDHELACIRRQLPLRPRVRAQCS